ncbi:DNA methylase-type I restriction-modification system [Thermoanaerobacterium thermosaccharolyticum]|uniref:DNA methylase-type I restriction-modification system n=2 Tax=Thermoanaerobacterium thermosaccharolyticum TaxID=1517 RepID=A0A223HZZ8_THETR|nr:DNA methylase-type I restriction-modification system [Thermoanaerobacterium thermosaccharolyticum]
MFITPDNMDGQRISYDYVVQQYKIQQLLKGHSLVVLNNICEEITSGIRVKKEYYTDKDGYRIVAPGDIRSDIVYVNELKMVRTEVVKEKDIINSGDVLITSSGKSGQIIYANEALEGCVVTSDIIKITLRDRSKGVKLYRFLKSDTGQMLLNSIKIGILNKIFVEDVANLLIPEDFGAYKEGYSDDALRYARAEKLYKSAENMFYKIIDYKGEEEYLKYFYVTDQLDSHRLDPEYYSNFYTELYRVIHKNTENVKWRELGELVEIKKADKPEISENQKVKYFLLADIDPYFSVIKETHEDFYGNLSNRMRYIVRRGEIVTAKGGSATGTKGHATALITEKFDGLVTTDALYNLVPRRINPYYLLFLFKQPIILNQVNMFTKGTLYKLIQRNDFEKIKIPRLESSLEEQIVDKMMNYLSVLQNKF